MPLVKKKGLEKALLNQMVALMKNHSVILMALNLPLQKRIHIC
jgi:hypothetical protein